MVDQSREPPHDLVAEWAVLGGILIDNTALDRVNLAPEDFYDRQNYLIFRAMQRMSAAGTPIDVVTLHDVLHEEAERPPDSYLAGLADTTPSAANIGDHAGIVRDKADRRSLITLTEDIYQRVYTGEAVASLRESLLHRTANLGDPQTSRGLTLTPWSEASEEPEEQISWVVEGMLPVGGLSLMVAKPKVGKSTLARCLAAAVAQGLPWLGKTVQQGPVAYLALEEKDAEVRHHFRQMGVPQKAPLFLYIEPAPDQAVARLRDTIEEVGPVLVIIDPLFRFIRFKDGNDYAEATNQLEPLLTVARQTGTHLLATHHSKKSGGAGGDEVLGSTGLFGAVDCLLSMKRTEQYRSCSSVQRYGTDLEEVVLQLDTESGRVDIAGTKAGMDIQAKEEEILAFLQMQAEPVKEAVISEGVPGKAKLRQDALRTLCDQGKVGRSGSGKKGDAYHYSAYPEGSAKEAISANGRDMDNANGSDGLDPEKNPYPDIPTI